MASSHEVLDRWMHYRINGTKLSAKHRVIVPDASPNRLIANERDDICYSYGRHFPLVRIVRKSKRSILFVVNGDRWPRRGWSQTSDHQNIIRGLVDGYVRGKSATDKRIKFESIIIPFSAMEGAGIDIESIRPIHVRGDRMQYVDRKSRYLNDVPHHMRTRTEYETRTDSVERIKSVHHAERGYVAIEGSGYFDPEAGTVQEHNGNRVRVIIPDDLSSRHVSSFGDGRRYWLTWQLLGDENGNVTYKVPRTVPNVEKNEEGYYTWTEHRHWLGDSLFSAVVSRTEQTVIVTDSKRVAEASGGHIGYRTRRPGEFVIGRDVKTIRTRMRFLSSFDYNEPWPLYFLAALPRSSKAETVQAAIDDLMPSAVRAAMDAGRDVIRQGDIFAVQTDLTTKDVYARAARRARRSLVERDNVQPREGEPATTSEAREIVRIFGTMHTATEVAITREGVTFIRGRLYHDVDRWRGWSQRVRNRDHVTRVVGDGRNDWYIAIRNTVPRMRPNVETVRIETEETYFASNPDARNEVAATIAAV